MGRRPMVDAQIPAHENQEVDRSLRRGDAIGFGLESVRGSIMNSGVAGVCRLPSRDGASDPPYPCVRSQTRRGEPQTASAASHLFAFVQQVAHLIDRHRLIFPTQRLLTFAFLKVRAIPGVIMRRLSFILIARGASVGSFSGSGIGPIFGLLAGNISRDSLIALLEISGIIFTRCVFTASGELFAVRSLLNVERVHVCFLVHRSFIGGELLVLRVVPELHIRLHQALGKLALLLLRLCAAQWNRDEQQNETLSHAGAENACVSSLLQSKTIDGPRTTDQGRSARNIPGRAGASPAYRGASPRFFSLDSLLPARAAVTAGETPALLNPGPTR